MWTALINIVLWELLTHFQSPKCKIKVTKRNHENPINFSAREYSKSVYMTGANNALKKYYHDGRRYSELLEYPSRTLSLASANEFINTLFFLLKFLLDWCCRHYLFSFCEDCASLRLSVWIQWVAPQRVTLQPYRGGKLNKRYRKNKEILNSVLNLVFITGTRNPLPELPCSQRVVS